MRIRDTLNRNPAITTGATLLIIFTAVGFIIHSQWPAANMKPPTKAFFTVDDGATWFADDIAKKAPFQKDGKEAVRAHVLKCPGGEPFVAYMERYTPEAKKLLETTAGKGTPTIQELGQLQRISETGTEYKKPAEGKWMKMSDDYLAFGQMLSVKCKNANDVPVQVLPE